MIEKSSYYEYEIKPYKNGWVYVIYDRDHKPTENTIIRESDDLFETEQEARYAAIGHICYLEKGER